MTSDQSHTEHHRFLAHHFETGEQQFQAGKLGMWLFLATEILFFSGMFCAYAVYRAYHPEIFKDASSHLDTYLGAANTLVLLASSLSVAWAVRCAQLNQRAGIVYNLVFTVTCAGFFMGVKAVEYALKFKEGLLWRSKYTFDPAAGHPDLSEVHAGLQNFGLVVLAVGVSVIILGYLLGGQSAARRWTFWALGATLLGVGGGSLAGNEWTLYQEEKKHAAHGEDHAHVGDHDTQLTPAATQAPAEGSTGEPAEQGAESADSTSETTEEAPPAAPLVDPTPDELLSDEDDLADRQDQVPEVGQLPSLQGSVDAESVEPPVTLDMATLDVEGPVPFRGEGKFFPGIFFSIYYFMTGIHAIHITAGIGVLIWITARAAAGHFKPKYYGPVEYVGLYWHLVDLIWIYLFPLLYLI